MSQYQVEQWKSLNHRQIQDGYYLSSYGRIRYKNNDPYEPEYHSSNGYDYSCFVLKEEYRTNSISRLFPIDDLIGMTFLTSHPTLRDVRVKINHIDGDNRNNNLSNLEWVEDVEEWRPLKFSMETKDGIILHAKEANYRISSDCNVWSNVSNAYLIPSIEEGYVKLHMSLYTENESTYYPKRVKMHRAMAMSFDLPGYSEETPSINHINGIKADNRLKNLEWMSTKGNVQHAFLAGLEVNPKGQNHPRAKFTDHQRQCIYEILKTLKYTPPKLLTMLIAERLPNISHDDVKYAKQVIKKTEGFEFPMLQQTGPGAKALNHPSNEEIEATRKIVTEIFNKYGITQTEVYVNEHKKKDNQG